MNSRDGARDWITGGHACCSKGSLAGTAARARSPTRGSSPPRSRAEVSDAVGLWVYHGALAFASLTCFTRAALLRDQRAAWIALGLGLFSWGAGDLYWTLVYNYVKSVSVARRCRVSRCPAVLLRRHRAPDQAANRPLHPRKLARRRDRRARRGRCRHGPARAGAGGLTKGDRRPCSPTSPIRWATSSSSASSSARWSSAASGGWGVRRIAARLIAWTLGDGTFLYQVAVAGYDGGWIDEAWFDRRAPDPCAAPLSFSHRTEAAARLQLLARLPLRLRRDRRGVLPGITSPVCTRSRLALGRDALRGDLPDGDQLPREHHPDGRAPRRRRHRCADRAGQPAQAGQGS